MCVRASPRFSLTRQSGELFLRAPHTRELLGKAVRQHLVVVVGNFVVHQSSSATRARQRRRPVPRSRDAAVGRRELLVCPRDELVREVGAVVDELLVDGRHGSVAAEN